ncbi:hypothetical protein MMC25_002095 [Agyrium rufum]|nr:hypothetical protein [Agyrium rufum]
MSANGPTKGAKAGLSLYANLLDPSNKSSAPGTISKGPVLFKQPSNFEQSQEEGSAQKQQISAGSYMPPPYWRPQFNTQKAKIKATLPKASPPVPQSIPPPPAIPSAPAPPPTAVPRPPPKTSLADWTAPIEDDDVNGFYGGAEKRQRGGRKKRRKNKEDAYSTQNWDDIYDPSRPNNYEEYKNSDEKILEIREWKDRLYAHRMKREQNSYSDSEEESRRPPAQNRMFAPPPSSAPPAELTTATPNIDEAASGEDAYTRRMRLSGMQGLAQAPATGLPFPETYSPPPPPPPPVSEATPAPPVVRPTQATQLDSTISRAPVRYNLPAPPPEIPKNEAELESAFKQEEAEEPDETATAETDDAPRSLRPGQQGFAERLMSKYGWTKGSGLGVNESGIVNPLRVQVEKQKKKPDSEGGGFADRGGRGKIIGGKVAKGKEQQTGGKFGTESKVVILKGMVDGMDVDAELMGDGEGGGLMQEIGEECGEKYGRVERVFIDRNAEGSIPVFVQFTSELSALRAVNALEGRIFNGNAITARFFPADKFEKGEYA